MKEQEKKEPDSNFNDFAEGNDGWSHDNDDSSGTPTADNNAHAGETRNSSDASQGSLKHWVAFRVIIAIIGILIAIIGSWAVFKGINAVIGGDANLNDDVAKTYVSVQSNYGFFAGIYAAIGIAIVVVAFHFRWAQVLLLLCGIIFSGGVARLVSMVLWGAPNPILVILIILELAIPVAVFVWYIWIKRTDKKSELLGTIK